MAQSQRPAGNFPAGLEALIEQCSKLYTTQKNPLQVTTILKYWLGGQDPLDYISMYDNPGNAELNIPPHWHYISFGLSDLHGDGRVHLREACDDPEPPSGMGFELTFRLVKGAEPEANAKPPTWPANLLQALARYVFQTGNRLGAGDNIPWRKPLDGQATAKIQHMLIADDAQMPRTRTPFGWVDFYQVVGVTDEELEQASRWNGSGVLNLLRMDPTTGGEWLVTDMSRAKSVFELFPETLAQLEIDLEREGSDLAGVNSEFEFKDLPGTKVKVEVDSAQLNEEFLRDETARSGDDEWRSEKEIKKEFETSSSTGGEMVCPIQTQPYPSRVTVLSGLEIKFAPYAARFLVLAVRDRIRHGRHFTFKSQNLAVTFVAESVTGANVNKATPYVILGYWMQVFIPDDLVPRMLESFKPLAEQPDKLQLPLTFEWPDKNLRLIVDNLPEPNFVDIKPKQAPLLV